MRTVILSLAAALALSTGPAPAAERAVTAPPPAEDAPLATAPAAETVVLAGGCFWGVQAVFQHVPGVRNAVSGYAGGSRATAQYEIVSSGRTGHAEAVEVTYDPAAVSLGTLLRIFFSVAHDPTQLDRQGADVGPQYRSAVFVRDDAQRRLAERYIAQLTGSGVFGRPLATRIERLDAFYPAERYHQDFATLNPGHPYIAAVDRPKVEALQRLFPDRYRETPVLVTTLPGPRPSAPEGSGRP
ncbi:MAG: peptide-methionine (S)-S-oxide reductase MsrA [Rhodospirillaceae bacterium]